MGDPGHAGRIPPWIEARRREVLNEISRIGWTLPGSVSTGLYRRCATPGCHCHDPNHPHLHGPYTSWFRQVKGKTITRSLNPTQATRYTQWVNNNQRLTRLIDELRGLALAAAQARENWPNLPTPPPQTLPHPKKPAP
jgi:hypothetical protein